MFNQRDLNQIEGIVKEALDQKTKLLPTKDEFFGKMDEVMGELKGIRVQQEIITGKNSEITDKLDNHESRISELEQTFKTS